MFDELIKKYPQLSFLNERQFQELPQENLLYLKELIEDALFWADLEKKPQGANGFKFLAATYGLKKAEGDANDENLSGKEREKFIRPHQDLYTMFNPYSGNGTDPTKKN
jgi:hypothetical protein